MSDFNNRIAAQRELLRVVNAYGFSEELFGLSNGAISRWVNANRLDSHSQLISLVRQSAESLFFLANKSQEQITDEYKLLSRGIAEITQKVQSEISSMLNKRSD